MDKAFAGLSGLIGGVALLSRGGLSLPQLIATDICIVLSTYLSYQLAKALIWPFYFSELRKLPGPKDNQFLIGQGLRLLMTPTPTTLYVDWTRKWPDVPFIRYLSFFNSEVLVVNNIVALKEVLQTKAYLFNKPAFFEKLVGEFLGKGLLFTVGDEHRRQRRMLAGPFSIPNLRKLLPVFQGKAKEMLVHFDRAIRDTDGVIEIESIYVKTTLDIVGVTLLGIELDSLTSSASAMGFEQSYHAILSQSPLGKLVTFVNPFIPLRWLPLEANRSFTRANTELHRILRDLARQRLKEVSARANGDVAGEKTAESRDVLTFMVETSLAEKEGFTEQEIVDHLLQFVSAGHETTAGALTWTTYALGLHPEMQDRLRREIRDTLEKQPQADHAAIESMQYLNNVCRESLRLYSPTITAPREAAEDMVVAGVRIPKGTALMMIAQMTNVNPSIWGPDADVFDPDRWDRLGGEAASPYAFETFSNGPRICIGKNFGMLAFKAVLVEVLSRYTFEPVDREFKVDNPALTLKPKGGLRVKVRRVTGKEGKA